MAATTTTGELTAAMAEDALMFEMFVRDLFPDSVLGTDVHGVGLDGDAWRGFDDWGGVADDRFRRADDDDDDDDADDARGELEDPFTALAEDVRSRKRQVEHHHRRFRECGHELSRGKMDEPLGARRARASASSDSDGVIAPPPPTSSAETMTMTTTTTTDTAGMVTATRKRPCDGDSRRASEETHKRGRPRWSILPKDERDFGLERLTNLLMLPTHEAAVKLGVSATTFKARYEAMKMYAGVNLSEKVGKRWKV